MSRCGSKKGHHHLRVNFPVVTVPCNRINIRPEITGQLAANFKTLKLQKKKCSVNRIIYLEDCKDVYMSATFPCNCKLINGVWAKIPDKKKK